MGDRKFTRIPIETGAIVQCGDVTAAGGVENLSLNGMLFRTSQEMDVNKEVKIKLMLSGPSSKMSLDMNGIVRRRVEDGFGIEFTGMYLDVFFHLKNIIALGMGDETKAMQEFFDFMGEGAPTGE
ncbi:MAG TPA: PilZ domain-containing protein [Syntrophobacter fumaroxidans]|nr:PilZ domain-containing protein [Syntrophobacter fumaroxidans]